MTDADGDPALITWGTADNAVTQDLQPTFFDDGPSDLMAIIPQDDDQYRQTTRYVAVVIPVGDPGVGTTSIYLRERDTDCIRIYYIGPGVGLDEAILFTQAFINDLTADN